MPNANIFPGLLTDTHDLATDLGMLSWVGRRVEYVDPTYGSQLLQYVKNTSGSSIAAALMTATDASDTNPAHVEVAPAAPTTLSRARCQGVTLAAIANGYGGWVVKEGSCLGTADSTSNITANASLCVGANLAGSLQPATVGTHDTLGFGPAAIATSATGVVHVAV